MDGLPSLAGTNVPHEALWCRISPAIGQGDASRLPLGPRASVTILSRRGAAVPVHRAKRANRGDEDRTATPLAVYNHDFRLNRAARYIYQLFRSVGMHE